MRIFSLQNMVLLSFFMALHGNIMDRLPQPLRQLLGKGSAVAMSEKFDMGAMLEKLRVEQEAVMAKQMQNIPGLAPQSQPYNFAAMGTPSADGMTIQFPVAPSAMAPETQAEVRQILAQAISGYVQAM
jgi:hypothetical protein